MPGVPDVNLVKEAQGITGALLWMSTRSRPDIAYAVSRMGQQATKVPDLSIAIGKQVLQYLNSTLGVWHRIPVSRGSLLFGAWAAHDAQARQCSRSLF